MLLEPEVEFAWVKPHEAPDFEERDPPLGHQSADVTRCDSERSGDAIDVEKWVSTG
jgi:hypothetical protein